MYEEGLVKNHEQLVTLIARAFIRLLIFVFFFTEKIASMCVLIFEVQITEVQIKS